MLIKFSFWSIVISSNFTSVCLIIMVPCISIESGIISLLVYFCMIINWNFVGLACCYQTSTLSCLFPHQIIWNNWYTLTPPPTHYNEPPTNHYSGGGGCSAWFWVLHCPNLGLPHLGLPILLSFAKSRCSHPLTCGQIWVSLPGISLSCDVWPNLGFFTLRYLTKSGSPHPLTFGKIWVSHPMPNLGAPCNIWNCQCT